MVVLSARTVSPRPRAAVEVVTYDHSTYCCWQNAWPLRRSSHQLPLAVSTVADEWPRSLVNRAHADARCVAARAVKAATLRYR